MNGVLQTGWSKNCASESRSGKRQSVFDEQYCSSSTGVLPGGGQSAGCAPAGARNLNEILAGRERVCKLDCGVRGKRYQLTGSTSRYLVRRKVYPDLAQRRAVVVSVRHSSAKPARRRGYKAHCAVGQKARPPSATESHRAAAGMGVGGSFGRRSRPKPRGAAGGGTPSPPLRSASLRPHLQQHKHHNNQEDILS